MPNLTKNDENIQICRFLDEQINSEYYFVENLELKITKKLTFVSKNAPKRHFYKRLVLFYLSLIKNPLLKKRLYKLEQFPHKLNKGFNVKYLPKFQVYLKLLLHKKDKFSHFCIFFYFFLNFILLKIRQKAGFLSLFLSLLLRNPNLTSNFYSIFK